jgi:DNA-directed RNA polymerase subunit RPC12/RpoP
MDEFDYLIEIAPSVYRCMACGDPVREEDAAEHDTFEKELAG